MPWTYLDDGFPEHPKVLAVGGDAAWLYVAALCWARRHLADGKVPKVILTRLTDRKAVTKLAGKLVDVGLWHDKGDHYEIHDYSEWNGSEEEARQKRRDRASKGAAARWAVAKSKVQASGEHPPKQSSSNTPSTATSSARAMPHAGGRASGPSPSLSTSIGTSTHGPARTSRSDDDEEEHDDPWWTDGPETPLARRVRDMRDRLAADSRIPADAVDPPQSDPLPAPLPDEAVVAHIAATLGWQRPSQVAELAAVWAWATRWLDRRFAEDVLLRCAGARSAGYLREAVRNAATDVGVEIPTDVAP